MDSITHDPSEYVRGLQQLLISDKKKVAFLFGAGTSLAQKCLDSVFIPAIGELTCSIVTELSKNKKFSNALTEIREEIGEKNSNIETILTNLEQKKQVIGKGTLNGLSFAEITELLKAMKGLIRQQVSVHEKILASRDELANLIHCDFAEWIGRSDRKYPIEIFTTNYDYLFEIGLETKNVPFYDGFTGSFFPFFDSDSVEDFYYLPRQTKLWKIHGSLGWHVDEDTNKVIRKDSSQQDILIYPSTLKYSDSKKQPYISLLDRLSAFLKSNDSILITCGYSFGDEHINDRIRTALSSSASSHVFVLHHDVIFPNGKKSYAFAIDSDLANIAKANAKISVYARKHAIIGCQYGQWRLKREPDVADTINMNLYFDEDAAIDNIEKNKENKGEEVWTGEGELMLTDFTKFVIFLKSMIVDSKSLMQGDK